MLGDIIYQADRLLLNISGPLDAFLYSVTVANDRNFLLSGVIFIGNNTRRGVNYQQSKERGEIESEKNVLAI